MKCTQKNCASSAAFRYTWPGQDEQVVCDVHAPKLRAIASAMDLHLQLIPIDSGATGDAFEGLEATLGIMAGWIAELAEELKDEPEYAAAIARGGPVHVYQVAIEVIRRLRGGR